MTSAGRFLLLLLLGTDPRTTQMNYLSAVPHHKFFLFFLFPKQDTCSPCFWPANVLLVISRNKHLSHGLVQSNIIKIHQSNPVKLNLSWKHSHCVSCNTAWGPATRWHYWALFWEGNKTILWALLRLYLNGKSYVSKAEKKLTSQQNFVSQSPRPPSQLAEAPGQICSLEICRRRVTFVVSLCFPERGKWTSH